MEISITVNGKSRSADVDPRMLLVDFLRDYLGLTGTKKGCETGECGACTVLLNGRSAKSCAILAVQADESDVITIEGLAKNDQLNALQEAFWENHAVQNGFSTPGTIMAVTDLLQRNPSPSENEIRKWLDGNLDRVTGYQNVVRAVLAAAEKMREAKAPEEESAEEQPEQIFGAPIKAREAPALLRGEAEFVGDVTLPDMLHAAILYSSMAHAVIKKIDTAAAAAMQRVVRVFTGADVAHLMPLPVVWVPQDIESHFPPHPSGIVPGGQLVLAKDRARFVGEQIAVVVAETRQQAYDALAAIKVEYETLPVVVDAEKALKEGAPQLHETVPGNLLAHGSCPMGLV